MTQDRKIAHEVARRLNPDIDQVYGPACCADRGGITGFGRADAEIMLVGIAPGRTEIREGRPFIGPSGKLLDATLKATGTDRASCYATNLCCFWKDEPTPEEIEGCSERLYHEIAQVQPRLIIACGALVSERLTGYKVGKARGAIINPGYNKSPWFRAYAMAENVTVLPTWHPAAILRVPSMGGDLVRDFQKIPRFLNGELNRPLIDTGGVVDDPVQAQNIFDTLLNGKIVAADVETEDDSEDAMSRVICMAVAIRSDNGPRESYHTWVFTRKALKGLKRWHEFTIGWVFHNGQFDTQAIYRTFGVWLPIREDTMLLSYACDERPGYNEGKDKKGASHGPGYHGLKQLAREFCSSSFYETEVKGTLGKSLEEIAQPQSIYNPTFPAENEGKKRAKIAQRLETSEEAKTRYDGWLRDFYRYNSLDAAYTLCLLSRLPKDRDEKNYREVLLPAANAYARVQHHGIKVDQAKLTALRKEFEPKIEVMRLGLQKQAHDLGYRNEPKLKRDLKARDEYEAASGPGTWPGYEPINLGSNKQMGAFLFKTLKLRPVMFTKKNGVPSTSADHLDVLRHPFCAAMKEHNQWAHVVGTYLVGAEEHVRPDGRFHSYPWLHGTATGRRSYTEPAMQTFPQDYTVGKDLARIREIIIPSSPEMVLIEADYCTAPGTKVLKADLTWVPVETLTLGDEVIGFDEDLTLGRKVSMKPATITATKIIRAERYRVETTQGTVICTPEHKWVTKSGGSGAKHRYGACQSFMPRKYKWLETKDLIVGDVIAHLCTPWETEKSQEAGYLQGFFDGEGWVGSSSCGFGQNRGETSTRVQGLLQDRGYSLNAVNGTTEKIQKFTLMGNRASLRFLGSIRPPRLLANSRRLWEGTSVYGKRSTPATVLSIEKLEDGPVVAVQTSTGTLITEGLLSHNCQIEVYIGALLSGDKNMLSDLEQPYYSTTGGSEPDYHSRVAREVLRCEAPDDSPEFKEARQLAKVVTFSLMYLVEPDHFASIISRPKPEAKRILFQWYKRYQDFQNWQQKILREMRHIGEITTPFGYRRRFPIVLDHTADKVAVNHPIQSTGGTLSLLALVELVQTMPAVSGHVLLDVHDSLLSEAPKDRVLEACERIRQAMCNPRIPGWPRLKVDIKIGSSWGTMLPEAEWLKQNALVPV